MSLCSRFFLRFGLLTAFICLCVILLTAQPVQTDTTTFDGQFNLARKYAFNKERIRSKNICYSLLNKSFNSDVALLLGRIYTWDKMYDSAKIVLKNVLFRNPSGYDAIDALIDLEYWNDQNDSAIAYCNIGLTSHKDDPNFEIKKAKALDALKKYDDALNVLTDLLAHDAENQKAKDLLNSIKVEQMKNKIALSYTYDYFQHNMINPWQLLYLQYTRTTKIGSVIGRINYANRFGANGFQYELDAYPKICKNYYGYLNVGYSNYSIFPEFRSGAELYHNFPASFEGSLGFRYLKFTSSDVFIYTAYLGKYVGNNWLSLRAFVTPSSIGTSVSGQLLMRRYFSDADNYLGLRLSYGTSPDDRRNLIDSQSALRLKSKAIRIEYNKKIHHVWILNVGCIYGTEEYFPQNFRDVYTFDITVARKL